MAPVPPQGLALSSNDSPATELHLAVDHAFLGNDKTAVQCLDSALRYDFYMDPSGYGNDPMFENLKSREDFKRVAKNHSDYFQFRRQAFSNALNRAQANKELKGLLGK